MSRPRGSIIGAKPTWTTTATSGIWTLRQAEEMKAANQWPRGPEAPTSLAGTAGDEEVALTWTAPATTHGTITDYVVEYTPAAGSPTVVATGSTAASYTLTGLTNGTVYTVRVAAVNHTRGDYSDSVAVTPSAFSGLIDYLVVAGGGGASGARGGAGGAGGFRSASGVLVEQGDSFVVTVGGGGVGSTDHAPAGPGSGASSGFGSFTATGGGGGGGQFQPGLAGGSGGGGWGNVYINGGAGNTPSVSPSQGNNGGNGANASPGYGAGGGGGAGGAGSNGTSSAGGNGGAGAASSISGASVTYAGGGGGGVDPGYTGGSGGAGGGGSGVSSGNGGSGTQNLGGGGGGGAGGAGPSTGGSGGSGVVIIRAPQAAASTTGSPSVTTDGSDTVYTFTGSGSITF